MKTHKRRIRVHRNKKGGKFPFRRKSTRNKVLNSIANTALYNGSNILDNINSLKFKPSNRTKSIRSMSNIFKLKPRSKGNKIYIEPLDNYGIDTKEIDIDMIN